MNLHDVVEVKSEKKVKIDTNNHEIAALIKTTDNLNGWYEIEGQVRYR
jgi:hypothetical protein